MFTLQRTIIQNAQIALYIFDILVTLEQSQGHQTYRNNADPKQSHNHAKFERSCFSGVREKANVIIIIIIIIYKWANMSINSLEPVSYTHLTLPTRRTV